MRTSQHHVNVECGEGDPAVHSIAVSSGETIRGDVLGDALIELPGVCLVFLNCLVFLK